MNKEIVINDISLNKQAIKEVSKLIAIKFMEERAEKRREEVRRELGYGKKSVRF
ncbi:hypothetical protein [uncultured Finegoldia sp.]|uniref:hypothetical protein n=1 Tax=uncultured Finegoldia sp. TaxID=328009 RepID=UPI0028061956|nr:hypothetical protein [uncultured Finegoldia sp.]MDU1409809.1 hypothetical protein [Veillonella sp.]